MLISLIHPSRSRPLQAARTFENWMRKASGLHKIEHIISVDLSDSELEAYKNQEYPYGITKILGADNSNAVTAVNRGAELAKGDILIMLSDDFDCHIGWDIEIANAYAYTTCAVLKTFDGLQKWIVTLAIMDRAYYEMQGYFYYPEYTHMFCDTEMTHKADLEGRLIMRNDLVFPHNHYSQGKTPKDAVNKKADETWAQGEAVYLKRVREKFGLGGDVNVYKVSAEAKSHIQWLTNKMK